MEGRRRVRQDPRGRAVSCLASQDAAPRNAERHFFRRRRRDKCRARLASVSGGAVNQDLIYSIGLIDYFADEIVVALLDAIHDALAPGGNVIVGNFHPRNPSRAVMDHVLEWKLIYRTEEDMQRLFCASAFRRAPDRLFYESQGINLFAECHREGP